MFHTLESFYVQDRFPTLEYKTGNCAKHLFMKYPHDEYHFENNEIINYNHYTMLHKLIYHPKNNYLWNCVTKDILMTDIGCISNAIKCDVIVLTIRQHLFGFWFDFPWQKLPEVTLTWMVELWHCTYHHPTSDQINTRLTHWGPEQMASISQTTYSNAFLWIKTYEFGLRLHWSLFLRFQLTIFQHCSDYGLAPTKRQAIIWTNGG